MFDALSDEGDLSLLKGAVAPGLLRALHGLKEMHAAAGLVVRMTANDDESGSGSGGGAANSGDSGGVGGAELGVMGLLDRPLFEAMSEAIPGFEDRPSVSREIEEKMAAAAAKASAGAEKNSSSSSSSPTTTETTTEAESDEAETEPKSKLSLTYLDFKSFREAAEAAHRRGGNADAVFSGRYQVLAVRFTGSVLVQTFAKSSVAAASSSSSATTTGATPTAEKEQNEPSAVAAASSKATSTSPPPQSKAAATTLTLVRELLDKRPHSWRFVRGPLSEGLPVRQLGLPWTLLSIDLD